MSEELPEGWASATPRSLFDCWGGMTPSTSVDDYWGGTMPWVSSRDVKAWTVDGATEKITARALAETGLRECPVGSVLVVVRSGVLAHTLPVAITTVPVVINQDLKALVSPSTELNQWLALYLRGCQRQILEANRKEGTTVQSIRVEELLDRELSVAPLPEQRRIVDNVESLLEQVNRAKGRLERVPVILKRFRQAVLDVACAGRLTNSDVEPGDLPPDWRQVAVDDLVEKGGIFDGARDHGSQTAVAQNLRTVDYTTSGVRVIRLENLAHLRFIEEKRTYISEAKYAGLVQNTIRKGDVLFGSFIEEQVRVCIFPGLDTPAIAKADCFCIRVRPEAIDPEYLALQLATKRTHDSLVEDVHGATRPRINTKQLRKILVPVCSPSEQQEIVAAVRRLFALADTIERRVQVAKARADKLPQAILSKAFSGELVPTEAELARAEGRTYETAEALLARIRNERGESNAGAKPGRKRRAAKENGAG